MTEEVRTLYVRVDYKDHQGVDHTRGDSVEYSRRDTEGSELLRRGVLSSRPVRREAGEGGRSGKDSSE